MRLLTALTIAVSTAGAARAIQHNQPARMLGIRLPGTVTAHAATIGTSLSAPPAMLGALLFADRTGRQRLTRVLAVMFFIGILSEADTWTTLRRPGDDRLRSSIVASEIALPIAMLASARYGRPADAS